MINVNDLVYKFKKSSKELHLGSFKLESGGITAFLGENGSGKSTSLNLIAGKLNPDAGSVTFEGKNTFSNYHDIKGEVFLLTREEVPYPTMSVKSTIELSKSFSQKWNEDIETNLMSEFKLDEKQLTSDLSKGELVKLRLICTLAQTPKFILIDELTNDLDQESRHSVFAAIDESTWDSDMKVVVATNQIDDIERYASHIIYFSEQRVRLNMGLEDFKEKYQVALSQIKTVL